MVVLCCIADFSAFYGRIAVGFTVAYNEGRDGNKGEKAYIF